MAKTTLEIKSLARAHTATALRVLAGIMEQTDAPAASRVSAATALLDRGWGKPAQAIVGGDDDDNPVRMFMRMERLIVDPVRMLANPDSESIPPAT